MALTCRCWHGQGNNTTVYCGGVGGDKVGGRYRVIAYNIVSCVFNVLFMCLLVDAAG